MSNPEYGYIGCCENVGVCWMFSSKVTPSPFCCEAGQKKAAFPAIGDRGPFSLNKPLGFHSGRLAIFSPQVSASLGVEGPGKN